MARNVQRRYSFRLFELLLILAWLSSLVSAASLRGSHIGSSGSSRSGSSSGSSSSGGRTRDMPRFYPDPDACDPDDKNLWVCGDPERKNELFQRAVYLRKVHGILAAVAVGVWLVGAVLLRLWKPKKVQSKGEGKKKKKRTGEGEKKEKKGGVYRLYAHMVLQMVGLVLFVAAAGIGFWLLDVVEIPGGGLLRDPSTNYHPIIGLVLFCLFLVQAILGFLQHRGFKGLPRRQLWSYAHLLIGHLGIVLGIINGALGFKVSYGQGSIILYSALMGALWFACMIAVVGMLLVTR